MIVNADPEEFHIFLPAITARGAAVIPLLQSRAAGQHPSDGPRRGSDTSEQHADTLARHRATAAVTLLRLGWPDAVWPLLVFSADPRLQAETIHLLARLGASPDLIAERFLIETDVSVRRSLLMAWVTSPGRP